MEKKDWIRAGLLALVLSSPASAANEGYRAIYDYFGDPVLENGQPRPPVARLDPVLDFNFAAGGSPLARTTDFYVRWEGTVVPKFNETYIFYTKSDDGVRVRLDGRVIIDNWTYHAPMWNWEFVPLQAGRAYKVEVDYFQGKGESVLQFYWNSPSQRTELVPATPAMSVTEGPVVRYDRETTVGSGNFVTSHGDTFYSAWGRDGVHYLLTDDTKGFDGSLNNRATGNQIAGRNVTVNTLASSPGDASFIGRSIDGNHQALGMFGGENEGDAALPQGGIWKGSGLGSYDGVLYLTVNDQTRTGDRKARATGASIMKSVDGGRNWQGPSPGYALNRTPLPFMFDNPKFSRIAFVQYGQDGASPNNVHDSQNYAYAVSNGGEWDNGDNLYLGRVLKTLLPYLRASDWQFYTGLVNGSPQWGSLGASVPVFTKAGSVSQTQMTYVPALGKYILPNWFFVRDPSMSPTSPDYYGAVTSPHTRWEFFAADTPWGPWNPAAPFHTKEWSTAGYYNPTIPNKFISGTSFWLLFTGNYMDASTYRLHLQNLTIQGVGGDALKSTGSFK